LAIRESKVLYDLKETIKNGEDYLNNNARNELSREDFNIYKIVLRSLRRIKKRKEKGIDNTLFTSAEELIKSLD
jgi:hypothetical protein